MQNFAEELAYWYFRLNGFFLIRNFVHHSVGREDGADSDLLGLRLRATAEKIYSRSDERFVDLPWDQNHSTIKNLQNEAGSWKHDVAVIVEIKGGEQTDPGNAFNATRLRAALHRLGFENAFSHFDALAAARETPIGEWRVLKFLCCRKPQIGEIASPLFHTIYLEDAMAFIKHRFESYPKKRSDWNHFPSDLIQFLAFISDTETH